MFGSLPKAAPVYAPYGPPDSSPAGEGVSARSSRWLLAFALVAAVVLLAPTLGYGLGYDQGMLFYAARIITRGRWLYVDSFDTALPGGPLLQAISVAIAGNSVLAFRIEDLLIQIASAVLLYCAGRRLAGPLAGLYAACAYAALYMTAGFYH